MIDPAAFLARLEALGVRFVTGVPDSLLKQFCTQALGQLPPDRHIIAANEGASIGLAIGHYLRSGRPALVYMQNSGFGNAINPLISLADPEVYGIPMLLLVGWRGQPGVKDEPQHVKQGRVMTALLDAMELPWALLPREQEAAEAVLSEAVARTQAEERPFVLLVEKDSFAKATVEAAPSEGVSSLPSREEALIALVEAIGKEAVQIATTGMLGRELFELRARSGTSGARDFLTVGGMGHASAIALGLALEEPGREVWCLDGDGAALMHLGGLPIIAQNAPGSFFHVVFNNGVHDSVGGQPTAAARLSLAGLAEASGYRRSVTVQSLAHIAPQVAALREAGGPALLELRVRPGNRPDIGRPTHTPQQARMALMDALARGS